MSDIGQSVDVEAPDDVAVLDDERSRLRDRGDEESSQVSFVELFYDLIFVFAVTQLAGYLVDNITAEGAVRAAILFVAVWWLWINTTWATNRLDPDAAPVRFTMFTLMAASLVLSMALPRAFEDRSFAFAAPYVAMQVGRCLFSADALARNGESAQARTSLRQAVWFAVSGVVWIFGATAEADMRVNLWVLALAIELTAPWLGFPVPGLGREETRDLDVAGEHLSERCGLFIIIALGETLLVTGARAAELEWTATSLGAAATAVASTLAMWWLYFDTGSKRGTRAFEEQHPGHLARVAYTYLHLPIVAGIVLTAVGDKGLIAHPHEPAAWQDAVTILGGPALFLLGNFLFKNATSRRWPLSHLVGIGLLALGVLGLGRLEVLGLALWAVIGLVATAALERLLLRSRAGAEQQIK
ncbi:low temperature requirement protein A [Rubellimicrobium roseum]|uniref:Low temperature requirement protein A n=1 Tax=Rubellimicrobium roseum TaxID=687525 RepID=A0A5C4N5D2_9RHOB|nr:low temperature requirement protein A [Rubellimicrobium roseum]TNC59161.1 low temperature requirement protein A [Rubellimicrobium roseum]